jgi:hypothetical protein
LPLSPIFGSFAALAIRAILADSVPVTSVINEKTNPRIGIRPPFVSLIHLHFFALGAGEVKRYMWRLCESKTLAELHEIQRVDIINVLKGN